MNVKYLQTSQQSITPKDAFMNANTIFPLYDFYIGLVHDVLATFRINTFFLLHRNRPAGHM